MNKLCIQQLLLILLFTQSTYSLASANECRVLRVAGGSWIDLDKLKTLEHTASGASILLLHKIPLLTKVKIEYGPMVPFARQLHQLEKGELDVIAGVYPTKTRQKAFLFSENYYYEDLFIYTTKDKINHFTTIASLKTATGAVLRKVSYGEQLDEFFANTTNKITVNNQQERISLLLKNRVDYFIGTRTALNYTSKQHNIVKSAKPISKQGVALAFSMVTPCKMWIPAINYAIQVLFEI